MTRIGIWLVGLLLKKNLTLEERNQVVVHILDALQAVPLSAIISVNAEGELTVRGRPLDMEKGLQLRESAKLALNNQALALIREQVTYEAIALGVHTVESERQMLFARAALWWGQQVEKHLRLLAQRQEPTL